MKRIFSILVINILVYSIVFSSPVFAVDIPVVSELENNIRDKKEQLNEKRVEACKKFTTSRLSSKVEDKKNSIVLRYDQKALDLSEKRNEWDVKRDELRVQADDARNAHYESLKASAKNDEHKLAVEEFIRAVEEAVAVRRNAQDSAREEYRRGVDGLLSSTKLSMSSSAMKLKEDTDAAIAKASLACENGTPVDDVMKTLKVDLEIARKNYKNSSGSQTEFESSLNALVQKRKESIEASSKVFKETLQKAKDTLRSAID